MRDERGLAHRSRGEGGFTLVEMMIAAALTMVVVGAAVAMATSVQNVYQYGLDDAAVQQEARFAMDWISRTIAAGASNPYDIGSPANPAADSCTEEVPGFEIDAGGDWIRVLSDVNPPNGVLAGSDDTPCNLESGEDVTIAFAAGATPGTGTITRNDAVLDGGMPTAMTDNVVSDLTFTYLDANRTATASAANVAFVQVSVTVQSKGRNPYTNEYSAYTYQTEVAVRSR